MTVTESVVADAIELLRTACVSGMRDATASTWAAILNASALTVTDEKTRERLPVCDERGIPVPLNPADREVMPAATRMATLGARFAQAADLAAAVQDLRAGDKATRNARIQADAQRHGLLLPEGLGADVDVEVAWRQAATAAIGAGATRDQAAAHAWRAVGRTPPAVEASTRRGRPALPAGRVP
jgi:hypothetical protein